MATAAWAKRNSNRELVGEDSQHQVNLTLSGTVGRQQINEDICGQLQIGSTNPTGSTKRPSLIPLLAAVLAETPKTRIEKLINQFRESGLPDVDSQNDAHRHAALMVEILSQQSPRAGSVKFISK